MFISRILYSVGLTAGLEQITKTSLCFSEGVLTMGKGSFHLKVPHACPLMRLSKQEQFAGFEVGIQGFATALGD